MKLSDTMRFFRHLMLLLNLAVFLFLAEVFILTPFRAARRGDGTELAAGLSALPPQPWTMALALTLFLVMVFIGVLRRRGKTGEPDGPVWSLWVQPALCILAILLLHLNYNGLLLLAVVDLVEVLGTRQRDKFLLVMISLYLLTSLEFLREAFGQVSVYSFMSFYAANTNQLMRSTLVLLSALNIILFITYMVLLVGQRTEEKAAIQKLNAALAGANGKLSSLNGQLHDYALQSERMAETRERNRLAREIHDTLGHTLTGITAGADACVQMMDFDPDMARKQMQVIADTARQGIKEVRRSVSALRPDALERFQLKEALEKLCADMRATSHAEIALVLPPEELRLSADEEDAVYRIVQEGVTNAIRHGEATHIDVTLTLLEGILQRLQIRVKDNGRGCAHIESGFGLRHMRERIALLGGVLSVDGTDGFEIEATLTIRWGGHEI